MYGHLGLTRDPCFAEYADDSYVESAPRARVNAQAVKALDSGRSLWLKGPAGSGRDSLLRRLASLYAPKSGRAVVVAGKGPLLLSLAQALGCFKRDASALELAEAVYARLLEGFWQGGPCLVFLPLQEFTDPSEREELSILSALRIVDHPLALVVCRGVGDPPCEGMEVVELTLPTPDELAALLRRRLALCGAPGLYAEVVLEVSGSAKAYGQALKVFGRRLGVLGFMPSVAAPQALSPQAGEAELFSPRDVEEVGWLLDAISRK